MKFKHSATAALLIALSVGSCSSSDSASNTRDSGSGSRRITVLTHESWAMDAAVMKAFTKRTGIRVTIRKSGDAGAVANQLILTKDAPIADVVYGIDSTFQGRAQSAKVLAPYTSSSISKVDAAFEQAGAPTLTPVDYGDVCINYDKAWFNDHPEIPIPTRLEDLTKPAYKNLLVVEDPARSSPGLAFLLSTIEEFGERKWEDYWSALAENGVAVTAGWEQAYNGRFTGSGAEGTDRPLVVSYATSPPAAVMYAEGTPPKDSPIGVMSASCYRQVEYVGVVAGTKRRAAAEAFVDFMLSKEVQEALPEQMFVMPVVANTTIPEVFTTYAAFPKARQLAPATVNRERENWIAAWTEIVL